MHETGEDQREKVGTTRGAASKESWREVRGGKGEWGENSSSSSSSSSSRGNSSTNTRTATNNRNSRIIH